MAEREFMEYDVVIVGAGFTGLWTARSLLAAEPDASKTAFLISDGQNTVGEAPETGVAAEPLARRDVVFPHRSGRGRSDH